MFKFSKIDKKKQIVGGIVYAPNEVDSDGDYSTADEIKKAMYKFMEAYYKNTSRININHKGKNFSWPILESFIPDQDTKKGDSIIPAGAWYMSARIQDKAVFDLVLAGKLTGFSLQGTATT